MGRLFGRSQGPPVRAVTSPRLRLNLFGTFHAFTAHERRHLRQAERVREALLAAP